MRTYLKLKKIFKQGYIPSRDGMEYSCTSSKNFAEITNCFEHACFNLKNEHLINFNIDDLEDFFSLPALANDTLTREEMFEEVKKAIQTIGLKVKKCKEELKANEWNVAMYVSQNDIDVHFLLQEKDGSWSGKFGQSRKVDCYSILPLKLQGVFEDYNLFKVFTIENPYINIKTKE